jgi:hypothetical protein
MNDVNLYSYLSNQSNRYSAKCPKLAAVLKVTASNLMIFLQLQGVLEFMCRQKKRLFLRHFSLSK